MTDCNSIGSIVCESFASALGASGWQDLATRMTRKAAEADKYEELLASLNTYLEGRGNALQLFDVSLIAPGPIPSIEEKPY